MFLLGNVIVDVEVLFANGGYHHRVWHLHTFLVGGLVGAVCGAIVYFAKPLRKLFEFGMRLLHIRYRPTLLSMILGGMAGVWMHVLIDSFYHYDVQPFYPLGENPLFKPAHWRDVPAIHHNIETICLAFFVPAAILYALAVWSFFKTKKTQTPS